VEVDAKVKELEDEVKVLKAEIRNVLLDIREAILDNTNPLSEQEPAYLRMDLTTTARSMAAEEATRAARDAMDQARAEQSKAEEPEAEEPAETPPEDEVEEEATDEEPAAEEPAEPLPEDEAADQAESEEETEVKLEEPEASGDGDLAAKDKESLEAAVRRMRLPPMQLAYMLPTGAIGGLAAWVTEAMDAIGPEDLERVITIHRLWGSLPPNISYALAHLQRLIRSSREANPPWLKVMQDMEKLASS
jgi:hypothetical protein